jgi:hypothetical protein
MSQEILTQALKFATSGISVVPVATDGSKRPGIDSWKKYQEKMPDVSDLMRWFNKPQDGLGLICGAVSGNLEMLELEGRAVAEGIHEQAADIAAASGLGDIWKTINDGYIEVTPSGGLHWLYRISDGDVPGNTKIARRPGENGGVEVLVETRGEGGFVIVAPSAGTIHPSGGAWKMLHGSPESIPTLTMAEREALHAIFHAFDSMPQVESIKHEIAPSNDGSLSPGDDYNQRVQWEQILEPLGWRKVFTAKGTTYWRRPGKETGISATTGRNGADNLFVFTTSTTFEAERPYSKFAAFAHLQHQNDFRAAARELRKMGFGGISMATPVLSSPALITPLDEEGNPKPESSWIPHEIDWEDDGQEIKPTIFKREDGHAVFYPGKINALFGESESGKTWVALAAVVEQLLEGNQVFYLDFEDSRQGIRSRLKSLGVEQTNLKSFSYANPDDAFDLAVRDFLQVALEESKPTLVVVDGVNAAMNLMGLDLEKNKDATYFSQMVLRPLRNFGAAVVTIDHVTKSKDARGNYAIGAQAKRADIDGCAIAVEMVMPFGRGGAGELRLKVTKDRPGFVRAICLEATALGIVHLASNGDGVGIHFAGATPDAMPDKRDIVRAAVLKFMRSHRTEMSQNQILLSEEIPHRTDAVKAALMSLAHDGCLSFREKGRAKMFTWVRDEEGDQPWESLNSVSI